MTFAVSTAALGRSGLGTAANRHCPQCSIPQSQQLGALVLVHRRIRAAAIGVSAARSQHAWVVWALLRMLVPYGGNPIKKECALV